MCMGNVTKIVKGNAVVINSRQLCGYHFTLLALPYQINSLPAQVTNLEGQCNTYYKNKTLGRARDPHANGAWLNKLTE